MGFDADPYRNMQLIYRREDFRSSLHNRMYYKGIAWQCENCGGESSEAWKLTSSLKPIVDSWFKHLETSHKMKPEDTAHWSQ